MNYLRTLSALLLSVSSACGSSHTMGDASPPDDGSPGSDGGPVADAPPSSDAGRPPIGSCTSSVLGFGAGAPCFCQGPFVISGDVAYRSSYEIEVIDISRPEAMSVITTVPQGVLHSEGAIAIANGHLFVGGWALEILSLADPRAPASLTIVDFEGTVSDIAIRGDELYMGVDRGESSNELVIYDVSAPAAPTPLGMLPLDGQPGSVLAWGAARIVVVLAAPFGSMAPDRALVVDVSNPSAPRVERTIELEGDALLRRRAALVGDVLFVAGSDPLVEIFQLTDGARIGSLATPMGDEGFARGITVADGLAFVGTGGIQIADVSDLARPRWIGEAATAGDEFYGALEGEIFFHSNGNALGALRLECTP